MTHDQYLAYLRSPWWTARKAAVLRYRGERCERCQRTDHRELHHRTYTRLGHELPEDVELLCERCHRTEHGIVAEREPWASMEPLNNAVKLELLETILRYEAQYG